MEENPVTDGLKNSLILKIVGILKKKKIIKIVELLFLIPKS